MLNNRDIISFHQVLKILFLNKKTLAFYTLIGFVIGFLIASSLPDKYQSSTVVSISKQFSGNAGPNLGLASSFAIPDLGIGDSGRANEALEIFTSYSFFESVISQNQTFFYLQAVDGWDKDLDKLLINEKKFDLVNNKWISTAEFSLNGKPSIQEAHIEFLDKNLSIIHDDKTGFIRISITHFSPKAAKNILETLISNLNSAIREKDIASAENKIAYLKGEFESARNKQLKDSISFLILQEIKSISSAKSTPDYIFNQLSPPIIPEKKVSPSRLKICLLFMFIAATIASLCLLFIHFNRKS